MNLMGANWCAPAGSGAATEPDKKSIQIRQKRQLQHGRLDLPEVRMVGGTGATTLIDQTRISATAPIFTFGGTPGAGSTYKVVRRCVP
jgi:hypothetical protein